MYTKGIFVIEVKSSNLQSEEAPLYTEKETSFVYEAKFFGDFVVVRPLSRAFHQQIMKMDLKDFGDRFDLFVGDPDVVRQFVNEEMAE